MHIPAIPFCWGRDRADMLLLWSKAALVSMKIAKSKNFSIALILSKFQRVRASCPTKVWKSKGTHYSRINFFALLSFCVYFGSGEGYVFGQGGADKISIFVIPSGQWMMRLERGSGTFQEKNLVLPWPYVHKHWFPINMKRETFWSQVRSLKRPKKKYLSQVLSS